MKGKAKAADSRNRFLEEQGRAKKLLEKSGDLDFLDDVEVDGDDYPPIPFPYGPQPNRHVGWR